MSNLKKGEVCINNIEISIKDSLTDVLQKTISLKKECQNINNYQHLYFEEISFLSVAGYACISFNSEGNLITYSFRISREKSDSDASKLILLEKTKSA